MSAPRPASPGTGATAGAAPALPPVWRQFICRACGYVYDEALGDPDSGLPAGTRFEDIPPDWACPLCGVTKDDFDPLLPDSPGIAVAPQPAAGPRASRSQPGVVIVGAGRAGWQLVEQLRTLAPVLPITVVTECAGDRYDKPTLSVAISRGIAPDQLVRETGPAAAARLGVRLLACTSAISIDAPRRRLRTTRGTLPYQRLVLAHGAQAALPPAMPAALCWRINDLASYLKLRAAMGERPRELVIVGAGLIGSELANDLALGGHRITLLDVQPQPLARWAQEQAGARVLQAWAQLPIRFVGGVSVDQVSVIRQAGHPDPRYRVTTRCGQVFEADQVIAAAGLVTPGRLARSAGLAWRDGIAVDGQSLATSDPMIHAMGDCITIAGQASRFIEPILRQARTIAAAIAGQPPVCYDHRPAVVRVKTSSLPMTLH